jgi:hypothetical protein
MLSLHLVVNLVKNLKKRLKMKKESKTRKEEQKKGCIMHGKRIFNYFNMKKLFFTISLLMVSSLCAFGHGYLYGEWQRTKTQAQCVKKKAFGLDFGVGTAKGIYLHTSTSKEHNVVKEYANSSTFVAFAFAPRFTYSPIPYLGIDIIKLNGNFGLRSSISNYSYNVQFLTGVRGNTPAFFKCMSGYAAVRLGYGIGSTKYEHTEIIYKNAGYCTISTAKEAKLNGFCLETELGLNITPTILVGFTYNMQTAPNIPEAIIAAPSRNQQHIFAFLVGFNFGK